MQVVIGVAIKGAGGAVKEAEWPYACFELAQRDPFRGKVCAAYYHSLSLPLSRFIS